MCMSCFVPLTSSSVGQPRRLFATSLAGVDPETVLWELDRAASDLQGDGGPAASPKLPSAVLSRSAVAVGRPTAWPAEEGSAQGELLVFGTEETDRLPSLAALPAGPAPAQPAAVLRQPLPQPPGCAELRIEKVVYTHRGQSVTALLCERAEPPLPPNAPLLVHVHGGPAIGVVCSQRMAADAWRYPYRHFLVAGFRVLQPLFRGTLGFGDAWAQANIGGQGSLDGDLGDVLAGLDFLNNHHERLRGTIEKSRTGIWGGSYGGYLTLRAMSEVPERFGAGVALYGFVHNRWMTYEGGDFTWEDEYLVPPPQEAAGACFEMELVEQEVPAAVLAAAAAAAAESASQGPRRSFTGRSRASSGDSGARARAASSDIWPLPKEMEASDNFNGLHRISSPLLLMHGEKDDICPLSQSQVAFHMLEKLGVPTGLVVYPGEGHGFDQPEHQQDRDRRMLAWFTEHLAPPGGPGSPPA
ncbi:unnamed protein product [Prorocentrum cordatum]|uniref:Peptidase S9 prolyl oligopeptidase catalytic domain-containing protein n=1 Tax=Prorocentrum cordatum TaxID=2364126 RepID=A0ABN9TBE2_9DINO|nr:unnamed protein product [Polarella glacialis]